MSRILDYIDATPWAMTPEGVRVVRAVAAREELRTYDLEAIGREVGQPLNNARAVQVLAGGVAVISVTGPLVRYGNIFTRVSGATSFEALAADVGTALRDPKVRAIVLDVDSLGGELNGTEELAKLIRAGRAEKTIVTLVSGYAASAAYWLASASSRVYTVETGILGSIGTVVRVNTSSRDGELTFVSSQSPRKVIDPTSAEGAADIQALLDSLAQVFIGQVAENLGITAEKVLSDFGQGGVLVGADAVAAGMAHDLFTLEALAIDLSGRASPRSGLRPAASAGGGITAHQELPMSDKEKPAENQGPEITRAYLDAQHPKLVADIRQEGRTEGAAAERERILGIESLAGPGHEAVIAAAKADPTATRESTAVKILEAQKALGGNRLAAIKGDEAALPKVGPGAVAGTETGKTQAEKVGFILGAGKPKKGAKAAAAATN